MDDIERVPSSVFRVTYAGITKPVAVTVDGRVIAHYVPISTSIDPRFVDAIRPGEPGEPATTAMPARGMTQAEKDAVLRKARQR